MNQYKKKASIFTYIPIIIVIITIICMVLATLLEQPTNRGTLYSIVALIGILNMFLMPLPCLILSIFGCIFAKKGLNNGENTKPLLIISIIEIILGALSLPLVLCMLYVGSSV